MEEELGRHAINQRGSRIICRYGAACLRMPFQHPSQAAACLRSSPFTAAAGRQLTASSCLRLASVQPLHARFALALSIAYRLISFGDGTIAVRCRCAARRQGNPLLSGDLLRVSVQAARAVIVVATDANPDVSDARVLRTVLALMGEHDKLRKRGHLGLKASSMLCCSNPTP